MFHVESVVVLNKRFAAKDINKISELKNRHELYRSLISSARRYTNAHTNVAGTHLKHGLSEFANHSSLIQGAEVKKMSYLWRNATKIADEIVPIDKTPYSDPNVENAILIVSLNALPGSLLSILF